MPKLTTPLSRLQAPPSRLLAPSAPEQRDKYRSSAEPWRKWYGLKRWKQIRWEVLVRDLFTCQLCGHLEKDTSRLVCDHIDPHLGDYGKFWNGPFQCLCSFCHSVEKQSQERGSKPSLRPYWLRPSKIPLTIVCGPPASGKSTYVAQHAKQFDLVIDLDVIAAGLSGQPIHGWDRTEWLDPALRKRNATLAYLSRTPRWNNAWLIVSEPIGSNRQWWVDTMRPEELVLLARQPDVCCRQSSLDSDRNHKTTQASIMRWWADYTPRAGDTIL